MFLEITIFLIGGALAGFVAGLLGIGGGLLVVPFLAFILPRLNIPDASVMHVAIATSLAIVVMTSISSIIAHHRRGGILWPIFWQMLPGIIVGAFFAAFIANSLPSGILKIIFGVFAVVMGIIMLLKIKEAQSQRSLPGKIRLFTDSFVISGNCNLLGLGGGSLLVPYFNHYQIPMSSSVATSALCGFPIALCGVIGLVLFGETNMPILPHTSGYIYWPAFFGMVIPSVLIAPLGAKLAHQLSTDRLKQIFALFLLLVGIEMLLNI
jgi:uncharacterized membrane protein YfcA